MRRTKLSGRARCAALVLFWGVGALAGTAEGRDRPGTPRDVYAKAMGAQQVELRWTNTAQKDEPVQFELEVTANGERLPQHIEVEWSRSLPRTSWPSSWAAFMKTTMQTLTPETNYCFRLWSRRWGDDVRSALPSAWACAETPPFAPHPPWNVRVEAGTSPRSPSTRISWTTPDQANHRPVDTYTVERQSPSVGGWILERTLKGPAGERTAQTQLKFAITSSTTEPGHHQYRLCSENRGGRNCAITEVFQPAFEVSGAAAPPLAARHALQPLAGPRIAEAKPGSRPGTASIKATPESAALGTDAEVEFQAGSARSVVRAPLAQLVHGAMIPMGAGIAAGRVQVRARVVVPRSGPWGDPVLFELPPQPEGRSMQGASGTQPSGAVMQQTPAPKGARAAQPIR